MSVVAMLRAALPASRGAWAGLLAIVLVTFIMFMPLRFALGMAGAGDAGLAARAAGGTIWSGRLIDARLGGLDIGTIDTSLRPLPVLLGRLRFDGERVSGASLTGSAETGWGRRAVHDLTGSFTGGQLGDVPVGQVALEGLTVVFSGERCTEASGRVRLSLAGSAAGQSLPGLSGAARCDNGVLLLPLVSDSGAERLMLRIEGNGRYSGALGGGTGIPTLRLEGRL